LAPEEVAMKLARVLLATVLVAPLGPLHAAEDEAFGHALTIVQMFVRAAAAQTSDPMAGLRVLDEVLSGRNTEANRAFAGLLEEATAGMPLEHRDKVAAIGRDIAAFVRKESAVTALGAPAAQADPARALQARKDLTAMGLRYYDAEQFLDAVKRDDALAVELYLAGRGVNVSAPGKDGRSALDIAKARGNTAIAELLARNPQPGR
jgi:hypothetical protein